MAQLDNEVPSLTSSLKSGSTPLPSERVSDLCEMRLNFSVWRSRSLPFQPPWVSANFSLCCWRQPEEFGCPHTCWRGSFAGTFASFQHFHILIRPRCWQWSHHIICSVPFPGRSLSPMLGVAHACPPLRCSYAGGNSAGRCSHIDGCGKSPVALHSLQQVGRKDLHHHSGSKQCTVSFGSMLPWSPFLPSPSPTLAANV